ncbi:MAG: outer membrane lipoprotein carrier protein LolA, partial [Psychrobium sp.]|nr:outer membrane lipoprotein carrier protein LolA [Psychrobium sp.]
MFTLFTLFALPVSAVIATELTPITPSNAVTSVLQNEAFIELRQKLKLLPKFSANFKQQVFDTKGQIIQESDGSMSLQQPNKFRW